MAKKRTFTCGTNMGNPEPDREAYLAHLGCQSECRIHFILPACGFSYIINTHIIFRNNLFLYVWFSAHFPLPVY